MGDGSPIKEIKTGWMIITEDKDLRLIINTIILSPPGSLIKLDTICEKTGVPKDKAETRLDFLCDLEVLEKEGDERYESNDIENNVLKEIFHLNGEVNHLVDKNEVTPLSERESE